jgi:hypothetical protein
MGQHYSVSTFTSLGAPKLRTANPRGRAMMRPPLPPLRLLLHRLPARSVDVWAGAPVLGLPALPVALVEPPGHLACRGGRASPRRMRPGCAHAGQGRAGQGRAGQGRAGQGRAGQGRAGQGRAGQGRAAISPRSRLPIRAGAPPHPCGPRCTPAPSPPGAPGRTTAACTPGPPPCAPCAPRAASPPAAASPWWRR